MQTPSISSKSFQPFPIPYWLLSPIVRNWLPLISLFTHLFSPPKCSSAGERIGYPLQYSWASLVAQLVKNPPAMGETCVQSLGWEDPLEKGKATHSSILSWRIPWTLQSIGSQRVRHAWATFTFQNTVSPFRIPKQCHCKKKHTWLCGKADA